MDQCPSCLIISFQVPYETLNRKFRNAQKTIDREVLHVNSAVSSIQAVMEGDISTEQVSELLSNMVAKLKVLKRKVLHAQFQLFQ